jgi:hypothetical protein
MVELRSKAKRSIQLSALSQNQEHFTAKDAKDAKEEEVLPRMNADEKGIRRTR